MTFWWQRCPLYVSYVTNHCRDMTLKGMSSFEVGQDHGHGERKENVPATRQTLALVSVPSSFGTCNILVYDRTQWLNLSSAAQVVVWVWTCIEPEHRLSVNNGRAPSLKDHITHRITKKKKKSQWNFAGFNGMLYYKQFHKPSFQRILKFPIFLSYIPPPLKSKVS